MGAPSKIKMVTPSPAIVAPIRTIAGIDMGNVGGCAEPAKVTEHNTVKLPKKPGDGAGIPIRLFLFIGALEEEGSIADPVNIPSGIAAPLFPLTLVATTRMGAGFTHVETPQRKIC